MKISHYKYTKGFMKLYYGNTIHFTVTAWDRGSTSETTFDSSTRKVSKKFDQTLYGNDWNETNTSNQPKVCCKGSTIILILME